MKTVAQISSFVFHPLLMPLLGVFFLLNSGTYLSLLQPEGKRAIYMIISISTLLLPLSTLPLLYSFKLVKSIHMHHHRERVIPALITSITSYLGFYVLLRAGFVSPLITRYIFGVALTVSFICLISLRWKISTHAAGAGGLLALVIATSVLLQTDLSVFVMIAVFLAGMVATVRLYLQEHNPLQVYAGFALGFFTLISVLFFF